MDYHGDDTITDGLFAIAKAIDGLAYQVKYLGNGDAMTPMGAIEAYGKEMGEKMDNLTSALGDISSSNEGMGAGLGDIARAISEVQK